MLAVIWGIAGDTVFEGSKVMMRVVRMGIWIIKKSHPDPNSVANVVDTNVEELMKWKAETGVSAGTMNLRNYSCSPV